MSQASEHLKVQVWIHRRTAAPGGHEVLLLRTTRERGDFWQPVTGSVDPGESLEAAAEREAREETALPLVRSPRSLGFEFTFSSRHYGGGLVRETVFEAEAESTSSGTVKLDPREHVAFEWVAVDEAVKRLRFESNIHPLKILSDAWAKEASGKSRGFASLAKKSGTLLAAALVGGSSLISPTAEAVQKARVNVGEAQARGSAGLNEPVIEAVPRGSLLWVSDDPVTDGDGRDWYRARLPSGAFGYISANDLLTGELRAEQVKSKVDPRETDPIPPPVSSGWTFTLRALGTAGYENQPVEALAFGGDFEFTSNLLFWEQGYWRRAFSIGPFHSAHGASRITGGSLVVRFYSDARMEPEVRLRAGFDSESSSLAGGAAVAVRIPFNVSRATHLAAYLELGGYGLSGESNDLGYTTWGGAGLGLHF